MLLSLVVRQTPRVKWFGAALLAALLGSGEVRAQSGPYVPPDAKGYRRMQIVENYRQHSSVQAEVANSRTPFVANNHYVGSTHMGSATLPEQVVIRMTVPAPASYVAVRGPDGVVRNYPVTGGPQSIVVVGPGRPGTVTTKAPSR